MPVVHLVGQDSGGGKKVLDCAVQAISATLSINQSVEAVHIWCAVSGPVKIFYAASSSIIDKVFESCMPRLESRICFLCDSIVFRCDEAWDHESPP